MLLNGHPAGAIRRHAHEDGLPDPLALVAPGRAQAELHTRWVEEINGGKGGIFYCTGSVKPIT